MNSSRKNNKEIRDKNNKKIRNKNNKTQKSHKETQSIILDNKARKLTSDDNFISDYARRKRLNSIKSQVFQQQAKSSKRLVNKAQIAIFVSYSRNFVLTR